MAAALDVMTAYLQDVHQYPPTSLQNPMNRVIAIDWSGAKTGARRKIWLAEARAGRLTRLESGRDGREVVEHLIADARGDVVVGLDFAFSFPRWFAEDQGAPPIEELWTLVAERGEEWLRRCPNPFWGRPGKRKPDWKNPSCHFRLTEQRAPKLKGSSPKSVFQIGGGGAVGTGSIRGMPHLAKLRKEGFSIWPFHEVQARLVIEIYPRLLTGPVNRSDFDERQKYLADGCPEIGDALACKAASSEDAFDAAVSAVVMSRHIDEISTLTKSHDPTKLIEGRIWWPREMREAVASSPSSADPQPDCPFCNITKECVVAESRHALALRDRYPVSCGHTLVIPKAHSESLFAQSAEIQAAIWRLVAKVRAELLPKLNPDGFNIGLNEGQAAGQTVRHAHVHLIPRFGGDVTDPRGGIRRVVPAHAAYWDK